MKSESPMRIWLAGVPCNASAERTKDSTITMRVKLVIKRIMEGASVSRVMAKRILIAPSTSCGCCEASTPRFTLNGTKGMLFVLPFGDCAKAVVAPQRNNSKQRTRMDNSDLKIRISGLFPPERLHQRFAEGN